MGSTRSSKGPSGTHVGILQVSLARYLVLIDQAGHLDPTNNATLRPQVVTIIRDFLRRYLFGNRSALVRFGSLADAGAFHLMADPPIHA